MRTVTLTYSPRRGGSAITTFAPGTPAEKVEAAVLTRFRARESATVLIDGEVAGGVEKLDRWTWWLDYAEIKEALAVPVPAQGGGVNPKALREAFADLRREGFLARQSFSCCRGCAGEELARLAAGRHADGKPIRGAVFYTRQDAAELAKRGHCFVAFGPVFHHADGPERPAEIFGEDAVRVGEALTAALARRNIPFSWDGNEDTCVLLGSGKPIDASQAGEDW